MRQTAPKELKTPTKILQHAPSPVVAVVFYGVVVGQTLLLTGSNKQRARRFLPPVPEVITAHYALEACTQAQEGDSKGLTELFDLILVARTIAQITSE